MWETFIESAIRHFRFLEMEFQFTRKPAKEPFAPYESDELEVMVYYDANGRHELDLRVSRLGDDPRKIPAVGMTEIMLLTDLHEAEKYQSPFPSTELSVEVEVHRLADLLKKYGSMILKNDARAFDRIQRLRREREKELGAPSPPLNRLRKT